MSADPTRRTTTRSATTRSAARLLAIAGVSALLVGAGATSANAESARSVPLTFAAGPYRNLATAWVGSDPDTLWGSAETQRLSEAAAGAWELGAAVRVFDESGAICRVTPLTFSDGPAHVYIQGWSGRGSGANCGKQKYTSVGLHAAFDGKGYLVVDSNRTAAVPWPGTESAMPAAPVNAAGETYGVSTGVASDPDLLLAVGDRGERGYLRRTSLFPEISSRAEAAAWMAELAEHAVPSIQQPGMTEIRIEHPLVASDGTTIVGTHTSVTLVPAQEG
jgi:hypothetical protein